MKTEDTFFARDAIRIGRVAEPFGWLGNMSPHPVTSPKRFDAAERRWKTAEALFQATRFSDDDVRDQIFAAASPMHAKMIAKKHVSVMTTEPRSERDVRVLEAIVGLKIEQHPDLGRMLGETSPRYIVEDCSARPSSSGLFWGAAVAGDGSWRGRNELGKIWMRARRVMAAKAKIG